MTKRKPPAPPPSDTQVTDSSGSVFADLGLPEPPKGPVHLYFLTTSGEVRSLERYRWRNGEWRSALTGNKAPAHFTISKWEGDSENAG